MKGDFIGGIPYRMALSGGWIDQPFMSRHNPRPPGSMVVVNLVPDRYYMERVGMATSTRQVAIQYWGDELPEGDPYELMHWLYRTENAHRKDPSGSQDMAGMLFSGISRLDYDYVANGGVFPVHIERCLDVEITAWLEQVIHLVPVNQRPGGYDPLGIQNLEPAWVQRLGQAGRDCFAAILARDAAGLGEALNENVICWDYLLPYSFRHPAEKTDLLAVWEFFRRRYLGAMYSGCGGGYLYVISEQEVPGSFHVRVRTG